MGEQRVSDDVSYNTSRLCHEARRKREDPVKSSFLLSFYKYILIEKWHNSKINSKDIFHPNTNYKEVRSKSQSQFTRTQNGQLKSNRVRENQRKNKLCATRCGGASRGAGGALGPALGNFLAETLCGPSTYRSVGMRPLLCDPQLLQEA